MYLIRYGKKNCLIHKLFPQARFRQTLYLDAENMPEADQKTNGGICEKVCPTDAINFQDMAVYQEIEIWSHCNGTGYDSIQLARSILANRLRKVSGCGSAGWNLKGLVSAGGPTAATLLSFGRHRAKNIAFIKCVGLRDDTTRARAIVPCLLYVYRQTRLSVSKPKSKTVKLYVFL
jgi:heterodisulfide reductase subunit A